MLNNENIVSFLKMDPWFACLSDEFSLFLVNSAKVLNYRADHYIFRKNEQDNGLFVVVDGLISISNINDQGDEAILAVLNAGIWFGEISLIDGSPRTHDARCMIDSQLLHVPAELILTHLVSCPSDWQYLAQLVSNKLRRVFSAYEVLQTLPAHERVLRQLVLLAQNYSDQKVTSIRLPINQQVLSQLAATSRQTCNQSLNKLASLNLISLHYQHIEVHDCAALLRLIDEL